MKKLMLVLLILVMSVSLAHGADLKVGAIIPSDNVASDMSDYIYVHENEETIPDPAWIDPGDGSEAPKIAKYTDEEWFQEHVYRYVKSQVARGHAAKYKDGYTPKDTSYIKK